MNEYEQEREEEEERRVQADVLMEGLPNTRRPKYLTNAEKIRGAMLNAEVTLQSVYDCDGVPGTLQRQARRDAIGLTEAIALLKGMP